MNENNEKNIARDVDIFREYRELTRVKLEVVLAIVLSPFILIALGKQTYLFAFLQIILVSLCLANALFYRANKKYLFPVSITFITATALLVYGIALNGVYIVYWVYPFLVVVHIYTPSHIARYALPAIIASIIISAVLYLEPEASVRFIATILLLYMYTTIFINVITKQQKKLTSLATVDPLTGAYNRNQMKLSFNYARERFHRGSARASLVYIDADYFKTINDKYGHQMGDRILVELVELINSRLRKIDEVFRLGGEEFVVLLVDTDHQGALRVANELRKQVEAHEFINNLKVTVSMGVAEYQKDQSVEQWIKSADSQLYLAKSAGRNCVMPER